MVAAINYPPVLLQSQKILHSFVVRQSDIRITYTYRRQLQRRVPCVLSVTDSHSVARKRGTRLSFSYILNLFNTKCDRVKQVVRPRTRVRAPHLSHHLSISISTSTVEAVKSKHLRIEELNSINDYLFTDIVNGGIRICMDMMQNMAEDEENEPTKFA